MKHKKEKIKDENLIHIKLEHSEAVQSKRDILSSEANLLRMLRIIKRYHAFRALELDMKIRLHQRLHDLKKNFTKMETTLPELKIPKILQVEDVSIEHEEKDPTEKHKIHKKTHDVSIETELQGIREKLMALQG